MLIAFRFYLIHELNCYYINVVDPFMYWKVYFAIIIVVVVLSYVCAAIVVMFRNRYKLITQENNQIINIFNPIFRLVLITLYLITGEFFK